MVPRDEFAAEWSLPIDLDAIDRFIESTARIYGVDPRMLRPRLASGDAEADLPKSHGVPRVDRSAAWDPYVALRRWLRRPVVSFAFWAIAVAIVVVGPDRFREFFLVVPQVLVSGGLAVLFLIVAIHLLNRYLRTADPFSLTGWNWLRQRTVTHYQRHVWWGIFGVISAVIGLLFVLQAVTSVRL